MLSAWSGWAFSARFYRCGLKHILCFCKLFQQQLNSFSCSRQEKSRSISHVLTAGTPTIWREDRDVRPVPAGIPMSAYRKECVTAISRPLCPNRGVRVSRELFPSSAVLQWERCPPWASVIVPHLACILPIIVRGSAQARLCQVEAQRSSKPDKLKG